MKFKDLLKSIGSKDPSYHSEFSNLSVDEVFQRALHFSLFDENERAATALENCIQRDSSRPEFYLQLARTYLTLKKRDRSIQILKDLLIRPELEEPLKAGIAKFLVSLLDTKKEPREVLKIYDRYKDLTKGDHQFLDKICLSHLELRNWDLALDMCKTLKAKGLPYEHHKASALLGALKSEFGNTKASIPGLKKLIKKYPSHANTYRYFFEISRRHKVGNEILALWYSYIISCPVESADDLADFENDLFESESFGEVLPLYKRAVQNLPNLPLTFYHYYVRALIREGQIDEACDISIGLALSLKTDDTFAFIVKEIIPHLDAQSNFLSKLTKVLKKINSN